jgi:heme/copper-type cytochrome/quinol oxidase subunit 2
MASALATALAPLAAESAAEEGKKLITAMLIVGLIFVGVIVLGETSRWLRRRRGRAH